MKWMAEPWCAHEDIGRNHSSRIGMGVDSIILHYTTGGHYRDTIRWFKHRDCHSSSAHFVVGRKGQVVQLVALDRAAWHAGDGKLQMPNGLLSPTPNYHSIGIEIANHGLLDQLTDGEFATDWGLKYDRRKYPEPIQAALHYDDGQIVSGYWEPFPEMQIGGVVVLCRALISAFGVPLNRILGHQDVALDKTGKLGWKKDPGPLWPWGSFLSRLHGPLGDGRRYRRTAP